MIHIHTFHLDVSENIEGTPHEEGFPDYLPNFNPSYFLGLLRCFGQRQRENAVLVGSGDFIAVDAIQIKASCEGAVGALSSDIIVLFVLFFVFGFMLSVDREVANSNLNRIR